MTPHPAARQRERREVLADVRERRIDLGNGARLNFAETGQGRTIVFLHGFPECWHRWEPQLADFGRDHRVLAPDTRGINLSFKPQGVEAYRAHLLAEDIAAFIAALAGGPVVVVGHDWGGVIAWLLAARMPQLVEQVVIVNAPHPATFARELARSPAQREASQYINTLRVPGIEARILAHDFRGFEAALTGTGPSADWYTPRLRARYREAWRQPGALTAALNYYRASPLRPAAPGEDWTPPVLARERVRVRVPTLVVWGMQDHALLPGCLDGLGDYVDNLAIVRIHEGSHWVTAECPARVGAAIREFIDA